MLCSVSIILIDVVLVVYTSSRQIPVCYLKIILSLQIHSYHGL